MDIQDIQQHPNYEELLRQVSDDFEQLAEEAGLPCGMPASALAFKEGVYLEQAFVRAILQGAGASAPKPESTTTAELDERVLHNQWVTKRPWRGQWGIVHIWRNRRTGEFEWDFEEFLPGLSRLEWAMRTTAVQLAYGNVEAEVKARRKLEAMLAPRQLKSWTLTESFYEQGRSGMVYWLRKNRPTVALRPDSRTKDDGKATPICALCLHALGGYQGTGAGILAPSDDVIAHLVMIRGNEHLFWRKANQFALNSQFISLV